jgi:hypothetical protein
VVQCCGPGSSVGTATDYRLDGPGFEMNFVAPYLLHLLNYDILLVNFNKIFWKIKMSKNYPGGGEIFRTLLDRPGGLTQPPVQWVPGLSRG